MAETPQERLSRYGNQIWTTSRADEGAISYTGANHVAAAVLTLVDADIERAKAEALRSYADAMLADLHEDGLVLTTKQVEAARMRAEADRLSPPQA